MTSIRRTQRLPFRHEGNDSLPELAVLTGREGIPVEEATRADQWQTLAPMSPATSAARSSISTLPAAKFESGFNVDAYRASERYRGIVQARGNDYITGGNNGLFTKRHMRAAAAGSRP